jgi:hypothetical protein
MNAHPGKTLAFVFLAGMALLAVGAGGAAPVGAATGVHIDTRIDGRVVSHSSPSHPIPLHPNRSAALDIQVTNDGSRPVTLHTVELDGRVVGLTFFDYATTVDLTVAPGKSTHLRYLLDLSGLDGQATGLIPATIRVLGSRHHELAAQSFVADVRGSLRSVYGLFGLALLVITVVAIGGAAYAIATHRMSRNRWRRALRFLAVGIGLGLVLVFTLSALRVWVPSPARWFTVVMVFAIVFFVIGYLTPTPSSEEDEDVLDEHEFLAPASPTPAGAAGANATDAGSDREGSP